MELVTPNVGTIFWMVIIFGIVVFVLKRFAWKPILNALTERESSIENALKEAQKARKEVIELKSENRAIIERAKKDKEKILREAIDLKDSIIAEAKENAEKEAQKNIENARKQIQNEKVKAVNDIKKEMADISLIVAEKLIRKEMEDKEQQKQMVSSLLDEFKMN